MPTRPSECPIAFDDKLPAQPDPLWAVFKDAGSVLESEEDGQFASDYGCRSGRTVRVGCDN